MLATFIVAIILVGLLFAAMAIGVMFGRRPLRGSCGGPGGECGVCGRKSGRCGKSDASTPASGTPGQEH